MLIVFVLLAGCGPSAFVPRSMLTVTLIPSLSPYPTFTRTPFPTHVFRETDPAIIKAFRPSATCPNVCWMGIHPGTTDAGQAVALLKRSTNIQEMSISDNRVLAKWFPGSTQDVSVGVLIEFSNGMAKSLTLTLAKSLSVGEFLSVMGEPEEIELGYDTDYILSYSVLHTIIHVYDGYRYGPFPNDSIYEITVNIPLEETRYLQSWLGYGRRQEYLSLKPMPTPTQYQYPIP